MSRRAPTRLRAAALRLAPALAPAFAGALAAGCTPDPTTAAGRLTDARTGAPAADVTLRLAAAAAACPAVTTHTDAAGAFRVENLCGEAAWTVAVDDPDWYLPEPVAAGPAVAVAAWRAPPSEGVYLLSGTTLTPIPSHTALDTVYVFETMEPVRLPLELPGAVPRVANEDVLLVAGSVIGELAFAPLVPSPERRWFGTKALPVPIDPWVYLGVRFASDTDYTRVPSPLDATKVKTAPGPRALRYVPADALPPGRHALPNAAGLRAWILDFGAPKAGG